nr:protein NLP7-like [Ipomoea batatas]
MTLFENDDDDTSLFIDPSAENLASTGLALPYAASPSHTRWLFNHGDLNWNPVTEMATGENAAAASLREWEMSVEGESSVVNHPQRDSDNHSVNTECDLLLDMGGGMIVSPPRPGMDYFSPLSGGKSNSEKTHTICRWEKDYGITLQALEQLFGKSRNDAAKTFRVSTATFKRACRYFGINRWPNHKVKRSNCSLNQKQHVQAVKKHKGNQSCPALPPEEATTTTLQGNSTMSLMSIKVTYEDNTIRFPLPSSSTLKYLEEQLETRFKICLENFSIMYQDEEADWISLTCDSDLVYGMDVLRSSGKTVVKMKIKPNFG